MRVDILDPFLLSSLCKVFCLPKKCPKVWPILRYNVSLLQWGVFCIDPGRKLYYITSMNRDLDDTTPIVVVVVVCLDPSKQSCGGTWLERNMYIIIIFRPSFYYFSTYAST
jgi:hypothetical protein